MARKPRPWYRTTHSMFHTTIEGKQYPLGITDPSDEAGAWDALKALVSRLEGRTPPQQPPGKVRTVAEAVDAFLRHKTGKVKPITIRNYARHLAHFAADFGTVPISALGGDADSKIKSDLIVSSDSISSRAREKGWSDTNTANYLATVEACLKLAGRPIIFDKPGRESAGAESVIPDPVYRACLRESHGDFHQLLRFLWHTGCRPSEATKLVAEQVDKQTGVIRLKQHKTKGKTGRPRLVYLGPEAASVVEEQTGKYPTGYLFRGKGDKPYSTQAIVMRFTRLSLKVGHHLSAYHFRHSFATRALKAGVPDTHVAALLGHVNTVMVHKNYSHISHDARLLRGIAGEVEKVG